MYRLLGQAWSQVPDQQCICSRKVKMSTQLLEAFCESATNKCLAAVATPRQGRQERQDVLQDCCSLAQRTLGGGKERNVALWVDLVVVITGLLGLVRLQVDLDRVQIEPSN